jgi:Na+/phosphate symporter
MSTETPTLFRAFWRTRRAAAIAGILFGVLLLTALVTTRIALDESNLGVLQSDGQRRALIRFSLNLVPFAGIAFLWFIGVIREQLGAVEDRLFSTVFFGSGLLFLAMLFVGSITSTSLLDMLERPNVDAFVWEYGRDNAQGLFGVYAMRMAAVFTLSVSTVGMRAAAMPRWVSVVGYVVAVLLLVASSGQPWLQLAFPAWVLMVSIVILVRSARPSTRDIPDG